MNDPTPNPRPALDLAFDLQQIREGITTASYRLGGNGKSIHDLTAAVDQIELLLLGHHRDVVGLTGLAGRLQSALTTTTQAPKQVKRRNAYLLPWGGFVEIANVFAAFVERGQVVIQLRNGGYIRSERMDNALGIANELTRLVLEHEPVDVVNPSIESSVKLGVVIKGSEVA